MRPRWSLRTPKVRARCYAAFTPKRQLVVQQVFTKTIFCLSTASPLTESHVNQLRTCIGRKKGPCNFVLALPVCLYPHLSYKNPTESNIPMLQQNFTVASVHGLRRMHHQSCASRHTNTRWYIHNHMHLCTQAYPDTKNQLILVYMHTHTYTIRWALVFGHTYT